MVWDLWDISFTELWGTFFLVAFLKDVDKYMDLQGPSKDGRYIPLSHSGDKLSLASLAKRFQRPASLYSPLLQVGYLMGVSDSEFKGEW